MVLLDPVQYPGAIKAFAREVCRNDLLNFGRCPRAARMICEHLILLRLSNQGTRCSSLSILATVQAVCTSSSQTAAWRSTSTQTRP